METKGIPQQLADSEVGGFAGLGLSEQVVEALRGIGFHSPTPIQAASTVPVRPIPPQQWTYVARHG